VNAVVPVLNRLQRTKRPSQKIGVEEIPGVAGDEWPHGAFVYLFSEKHKDKDCFFKCQPA